jgi:heat-inducible transcriptional repressor
MALSERETEIISCIIESYIASAQPVGSRTVAKISGLRLSPATMRNVMADLTEKGYLEQPHTSAGRVPTAEAFRLYLDTLPLDQPSLATRTAIAKAMAEAGIDVSDILRSTGRLLSQHSSQLGLAIAPRTSTARVKRIEFMRIEANLVLAVIILAGGIIMKKLVRLQDEVTADDLTAYANYLNDLFADKTVSQVRTHILGEMHGARKELSKRWGRAFLLVQEAMTEAEAERLYFEGAVNIIDQPEFAGKESVRDLFDLLDKRTRLLELLDKAMDRKGASVLLGENLEGPFTDCSLVSAPYTVHGETQGAIGVIGPMRMNYAQVLPMVVYTARRLEELLTNQFS